MKPKPDHLTALAGSLDLVVVGGHDCATFGRLNVHNFCVGESTARESRRR